MWVCQVLNIIYCRSIDTVSEIFLTFKDSLGADAYFDKKKQVDNILVEMYHKSTHQDSKERILTEFKTLSTISRISTHFLPIWQNRFWTADVDNKLYILDI
jgi:hypothetical protein